MAALLSAVRAPGIVTGPVYAGDLSPGCSVVLAGHWTRNDWAQAGTEIATHATANHALHTTGLFRIEAAPVFPKDPPIPVRSSCFGANLASRRTSLPARRGGALLPMHPNVLPPRRSG